MRRQLGVAHRPRSCVSACDRMMTNHVTVWGVQCICVEAQDLHKRVLKARYLPSAITIHPCRCPSTAQLRIQSHSRVQCISGLRNTRTRWVVIYPATYP